MRGDEGEREGETRVWKGVDSEGGVQAVDGGRVCAGGIAGLKGGVVWSGASGECVMECGSGSAGGGVMGWTGVRISIVYSTRRN